MSDALPFFSVMIPTWNPNPVYLRETLDSVLAQDWGVANMQISVCDDASPEVDVRDLLRSWGLLARVEFVAGQQNLGIGGAWNRCIEHARGEWIHILHQDDRVLDGFYERARAAAFHFAEADWGIFRNRFFDDERFRTLSICARTTVGLLPDLLDRLLDLDIQCPAVLVKRATYERFGRFRTDLVSMLDREMWTRLASVTVAFYDPEPLAAFRVHEDSQSARVRNNGALNADLDKVLEDLVGYHPPEKQSEMRKRLRKRYKTKDAFPDSVYGYLRKIFT